MNKRIKDANSFNILKKLKNGQYNDDSQSSVISILLHALVIPTSKKTHSISQSKKKHFSKSTILDSRNAFFIVASTQSELKSKIKHTTDEYFSEKITIQPIICGIGNDFFDTNEYFVYFSNVYYKFNNIVKCIDICFKIFHVLNLKYPNECKLVWLFFQKFLYEINLQNDDNCSSLCAIIND